MLDTVTALLPLYALVALGWLARRHLDVPPQPIAQLLIYFFVPAVIFLGAFRADIDAQLITLPAMVFAAACTMALGALALARRFLPNDGSAPMTAFALGTTNSGYFGIPAVLALVGPEALPVVVLATFGFLMFENTLGYYLINRARFDMRATLKRCLALPGLHAFYLGLIVNLAGVEIPAPLTDTLTFLAGGFTACGMMIVGLALGGAGRADIDLRFNGFLFIGKFAVWPAVGAALIGLDAILFDSFDSTARHVLMIECLTPLAANAAAFAALLGLQPAKMSMAVLLNTLAAMAVMPVGLWLLGPLLGF